jgi:hypothetical protein
MASRGFLRIMLAFLAILLLFGQAAAHLDLSLDELTEYHANIKRGSEALSQCLQSPGMREHNARMVARREQTLDLLRETQGMAPQPNIFYSTYPSAFDLTHSL